LEAFGFAGKLGGKTDWLTAAMLTPLQDRRLISIGKSPEFVSLF